MRAADVLIRTAAGPRIGFGHLVRARSLARALGGAIVTIRGGADACAAAERLGLRIEHDSPDEMLAGGRAAIVVIDDPSAVRARGTLTAARRHGVPVLSLHDLGVASIASDIAVDGTIAPGAYLDATSACCGPRFAVLDPNIAAARDAAVRRQRGRVLIALGGGPHDRAAEAIASAILERTPRVHVRIAGGFAPALAHLSGHCRVAWLGPRPTLVPELQRCEVAVVAGGMTMYEAAALGTPTVGVAIVRAQRPTIEGFARRGAALDGGLARSRGWIASGPAIVAEAVERLRGDAHGRALAARRASALVDGLGVFRVADVIRALAATGLTERRAG